MPPVPQSLACLKDPEGCVGITFSVSDFGNDPSYVVIPQGIPYGDVMANFDKFFRTGRKPSPWKPFPVASYYRVGDGKNCTAWNYRDSPKQTNPACVIFHKDARTAAHLRLPFGTVARIEADVATYVEKRCSGHKDTGHCFQMYPHILEEARGLADYLPGPLIVFADVGPYAPRDVDLSTGSMEAVAGQTGSTAGVMPVRISVVALPIYALQESARKIFQ